MGHFKKRHIPIMMAIGIGTMGILLFLVSKILSIPEIYVAFGMSGVDTPIYAGLFFATILFGPLDLVLSISGNWLSRRFEYQADRYAVTTVPGGGTYLANALKKMTSEALGNLTPHPLKVFLEYSHPPVVQRIKALRESDDKNQASTAAPAPTE
jgi:STE24 endopeptidase